MRPVVAEALGAFWIVLVVGGLAAQGLVAPGLGMGAAAGLAYLAGALTLGQITMGHFSPALTVGLRGAGGFGGSLSLTLMAQVLGASIALLLIGPPPALAEDIAPFAAMVLLVPLIAVPVVVHVAGMNLRAEAVAYANAVALTAAVALAPGGHASLNAAHATAAWITGDGAPIGLWRIWLATFVAVAVAGALWSVLRPVPEEGTEEDDEETLSESEEDEAGDADDAAPATAGKRKQRPARQRTAEDEESDDAEIAARALTADALIEAGWTPPATQKGRVRKNTPLRGSGSGKRR